MDQTKQVKNYQYKLRHVLGEGSFGKVYEGTDINTNKKIAIKVIDSDLFKNDKYLKKSLIGEISILKRFNHPNIVNFKDIIQQKEAIYIITEYCKDGDLKFYMKHNQNQSEEQVVRIFTQILQGMWILYTSGVIHRDLKPANILINEGIFKIADFGFARDVDYSSNKLLVSCVGSPMYMDPLILSRKPYSTKCDMWSLGIILYELLYGEVPWPSCRNEQQLLLSIYTKPISFSLGKKISQKMQNIIKQMLQTSDEQRMSWDELFQQFGIGDKARIAEMETVGDDKIFNELMKERNYINFKHFVSVELVNKYKITKANSGKESKFDKFVFFLCLNTLKMSDKLIKVVNEYEKQRKELFKSSQKLIAIRNSIKKEHEYYQIIYDDFFTITQLNGSLKEIQNENNVGNLIEKKDLTQNNIEHLEYYVNFHSKKLAGKILNNFQNKIAQENNDNYDTFYNVLISCSYIIDMVIVKQFRDANQEFNYEQFHLEKSTYNRAAQYYQILTQRLNKLL